LGKIEAKFKQKSLDLGKIKILQNQKTCDLLRLWLLLLLFHECMRDWCRVNTWQFWRPETKLDVCENRFPSL